MDDLKKALEFIFGFIGWAAGVFMLAMFTAFSGTVHGAPIWYLFYLGITQAIPLLIGSIISLIMIFRGISGLDNSELKNFFNIPAGIYAASFAVLLLLEAVGLF
ncbi:MAG: hypothetical protein ACPHLK_00250 [Gammaproteobacteria bacterium]|jgi:hypothetical protein